MIKNERQYRITRSQAAKFEVTVAQRVAAGPGNLHPLLRRAELDGLASQLEDLKTELRDYENLRSGKRQTLQFASIGDFPAALIQARIASGLSQEDLAAKLGMKPQQLQRYEATNYQSASLERVTRIVEVLGIKLRHPVEFRLVS
jgi:DNA-binding XRE family transcriptional regulator